MDRKIIWTEKSSSDIETIVRYIACRDPKAAAPSDLASTTALKSWFNIPKPERSWMNCGERLAQTHFSSMENCIRDPWRQHHHRQGLAGGDGRSRFANAFVTSSRFNDLTFQRFTWPQPLRGCKRSVWAVFGQHQFQCWFFQSSTVLHVPHHSPAAPSCLPRRNKWRRVTP